jgi:DNA-directed RNA polymerase specialized sigma24 family protein
MGSVTQWIRQLQAGEREAVGQLWEAYSRRLVGLARKKLGGSPRAAADEEDVALSAFKSFCFRAEEGRFRQLVDRNDLWQILFLITARKAYKRLAHELNPKHGGGKVVHVSALPRFEREDEPCVFAEIIGREPDAQVAAEVTEECRRLLEMLGDAELRAVAVAKMEGYSNAEIAEKIGRAEVTVERKLRTIRRIWRHEMP